MDNDASKPPLSRMNRRQMLTTTTALVGGMAAGVTSEVFGQEKSQRAPSSSPAARVPA
jgi:hypothetical protein